MVEAAFNLGALHLKLAQHDSAIERLRHVVRQRPDFSEALCLLAQALQERGEQEEAIALLTKAVEQRPDDAALHHALGRLHVAAGNFDPARESLEAAIATRPGWGVPYYDLSQIHRFTTDDQRITAMERLLAEPQRLSLDDGVALHLALYKALADIGRDDAAFSHLLAANTARRGAIQFDESAADNRDWAIRRVFDSSLFARYAGQGSLSHLPIFVVGFPRSGTTLVEQILASHSRVYGAGERTDIGDMARKLSKPGAAYPDSLAGEDVPSLAALGDDVAARLCILSTEAAHVVDKLPANYRHLGLIHLILPRAAIIHVRREAMDTCFSCFENDFGERQPFSYDLGELGRRYRAYRALMEQWRRVLPAKRILEVDYEALVNDLSGEVRRLLSYCGLDWDERCLRFHETRRPVVTQSQAQVRRPLYGSSVGRWRRFERQLAPLAAALGEGAG